ncbi:MAG: tyrosine-protein phosphatase [Bacteroidales bacterium]|nr:tyrosine-protein phosphatase [Bacteroidales bacterium]
MKEDTIDINFKSVPNFRDLGGIAAEGGKKIKKGIIFRSANPDALIKPEIQKFQLLNIRTIVDLRAPHEYNGQKSFDHIDHLSLPLDFQQITRERFKPYINKKNSETAIADISNSLYLDILDAAQPLFRQVMEVLLSRERYPVLIHCHVGKDRTGIICALLLSVLGTGRQLIIEDFMKSNEALRPAFEKMFLKKKILTLGLLPPRMMMFAVTVRQRNIESVLDRITDHYGGIEAYLGDTGFDLSRLPELKKNVLVD